MVVSRGIPFNEVSKLFLSNETYEVLNKYNCFEKIQKFLDDHHIWPGDLLDLACFFNNTTVVRIIKDQKEIIVNDILPNQMLFIDFRSKSYDSTEEKVEQYIKRFNLFDCFCIGEAYDEDLDDFAILLYKENDGKDYKDEKNNMKKLLYSSHFVLTNIFTVEAVKNMSKDYDLDTLVQMALEGSNSACFELGKIYFTGERGIKDYDKAFHYTLLSAEQGNIYSIIQLAEFYTDGIGTKVNVKEAKKLLELVLDTVSKEDNYKDLLLAKNTSELLWKLLVQNRELLSVDTKELSYVYKLKQNLSDKFYYNMFTHLQKTNTSIVDKIDINSLNINYLDEVLKSYYDILSYLKRNPEKIDNIKMINTFYEILDELSMVIHVIGSR